jgi:hypothetical protein
MKATVREPIPAPASRRRMSFPVVSANMPAMKEAMTDGVMNCPNSDFVSADIREATDSLRRSMSWMACIRELSPESVSTAPHFVATGDRSSSATCR